MKTKATKEHSSEKGEVMFEYVIIAAVMVTGLLTGIYVVQQDLQNTFSEAGSAIGFKIESSDAFYA